MDHPCVLCAWGCLIALYYLVPGSADAQHLVYQSLGVLGVLGVSLGISWHRSDGPLGR